MWALRSCSAALDLSTSAKAADSSDGVAVFAFVPQALAEVGVKRAPVRHKNSRVGLLVMIGLSRLGQMFVGVGVSVLE